MTLTKHASKRITADIINDIGIRFDKMLKDLMESDSVKEELEKEYNDSDFKKRLDLIIELWGKLKKIKIPEELNDHLINLAYDPENSYSTICIKETQEEFDKRINRCILYKEEWLIRDKKDKLHITPSSINIKLRYLNDKIIAILSTLEESGTYEEIVKIVYDKINIEEVFSSKDITVFEKDDYSF